MTAFDRFAKWLLDGRHRWGVLSFSPGRYGARSIRLVIYPPDSTEAERRCSRLSRLWPRISAGTTAVLAPALAVLVEVPIPVTIVSMALVVIPSAVILARISAPTTERSVELFASVSSLSPGDPDRDRYDRTAEIAETLRTAERLLDSGEIPWSRYQALWVASYRTAIGLS